MLRSFCFFVSNKRGRVEQLEIGGNITFSAISVKWQPFDEILVDHKFHNKPNLSRKLAVNCVSRGPAAISRLAEIKPKFLLSRPKYVKNPA